MAQGQAHRRLAAILAADVAGYSRLMNLDEEGTLARLKECRRNLVDPKIAEHHGRIVKTTGDGMLLEFPSVIDAVRCAVEVQRQNLERNATIPESGRIRFRVGINLGDIIVDGGDIFGDGVNIAARLEALAEAGGIYVSGVVWEQIEGKLPYAFKDLGLRELKNIARPVHVYGLSPEQILDLPMFPSGSGVPHSTESTEPPPISIVVLPFNNMSNDPEEEYFSDGITDDLTTDLSRISESFVIARNTAFTYKGKSVDVKELGQELGVQYVLEGSVRKSAKQARVKCAID